MLAELHPLDMIAINHIATANAAAGAWAFLPYGHQ